MKYREASRPDFDAIEKVNGVIYHLRGGYELVDSSHDVYMPVNRSYRRVNGMYTNRNRVINDSVDNDVELVAGEKVVTIYGKPLLFLKADDEHTKKEYSTNPHKNPDMSPESKALISEMRIRLSDMGYIADLGVYGSHQVRLNRLDSDLDLVMRVSRQERDEILQVVADIFEDLGYTPVDQVKKIYDAYADRYSRRTGLPLDVGYFLAQQRLRWISPSGTSTSLQCLHSDYDHDWAAQVVDASNAKYEVQPASLYTKVEVVGSPEANNFPRLWRVVVDGEEASAISFDWAHQGMGSDINEFHTMRAQKVLTCIGEAAYVLSQHSDFILPSHLIE